MIHSFPLLFLSFLPPLPSFFLKGYLSDFASRVDDLHKIGDFLYFSFSPKQIAHCGNYLFHEFWMHLSKTLWVPGTLFSGNSLTDTSSYWLRLLGNLYFSLIFVSVKLTAFIACQDFNTINYSYYNTVLIFLWLLF